MERFKKIVILQNQQEAEVMNAALEESKIPHRIRSYHDSALDGLYQITKGWGHVEAPEEYGNEIKSILSGMPGKIIEEDEVALESEGNDEDDEE